MNIGFFVFLVEHWGRFFMTHDRVQTRKTELGPVRKTRPKWGNNFVFHNPCDDSLLGKKDNNVL